MRKMFPRPRPATSDADKMLVVSLLFLVALSAVALGGSYLLRSDLPEISISQTTPQIKG
jgi:hypothetical protein